MQEDKTSNLSGLLTQTDTTSQTSRNPLQDVVESAAGHINTYREDKATVFLEGRVGIPAVTHLLIAIVKLIPRINTGGKSEEIRSSSIMNH